MSKIESGRWSEQLRRMFGMKGQELVSAELSPEVSPTIQLEGPDAEWNFLKGVRDCAAGDTLAAAVGFQSKWRVRNPADSGVIGILEEIELVSSTGALAYRVTGNAQTVNFPTVVLSAVTDGRWGAIGDARPALIVSASNTQATGPAGEIFVETRRAVDVEFRYSRPLVLIPGACVDFGTPSFNLALFMWVRWRERAVAALEL